MLESDFCAQIVEAIESLGGLTFKVHGHGMQKAGWPDLQVYSPRWTGHIELKVNEKLSDLQRIVIKDLGKRGTPALVLRWVGGAVQAEDADFNALGHIPADQWVKKYVRAQKLFSLLEISTVLMRDCMRIRPWVPQWMMDEHGKVIGQYAYERSERTVVGEAAEARAAGGGQQFNTRPSGARKANRDIR